MKREPQYTFECEDLRKVDFNDVNRPKTAKEMTTADWAIVLVDALFPKKDEECLPRKAA